MKHMLKRSKTVSMTSPLHKHITTEARCLTCRGRVIPDGSGQTALCNKCVEDKQLYMNTYGIFTEKQTASQGQLAKMHAICKACLGRSGTGPTEEELAENTANPTTAPGSLADIEDTFRLCGNKDCEVFYTRAEAIIDLKQSNATCARFAV